MGVLKVNTR